MQELLNYLDAGFVKRMHTTRHIGEYTVGQHTYGALCFLYYLYNYQPPANSVFHLLSHDVVELFTGDIPNPAKRVTAFQRELLHVEGVVKRRHFPNTKIQTTLAEELRVITLCDKLDLLYHLLQQLRLGNTTQLSIVYDIFDQLELERLVHTPKEKDLIFWFQRQLERLGHDDLNIDFDYEQDTI